MNNDFAQSTYEIEVQDANYIILHRTIPTSIIACVACTRDVSVDPIFILALNTIALTVADPLVANTPLI